MELESYEAELADYTLQETTFYEASTHAVIHDRSMSAVNINTGKENNMRLKKNRKCVTFIPNYIQVRLFFDFHGIHI